MEHAPIPPDEQSRLSSLRSLELLDTPPEERFDRITRLAQRLFNVPIAMVTLIDEDRQWFKSVQGLDATSSSRDTAFCSHTILGSGLMEVPDAFEDPRFAASPLVTGNPNIRFYAGMPIHAPDGAAVGSLCLIDRRPRKMSAEDLESLADLTEMVQKEISAFHLVTTDELTGLSNRRGFVFLGRKILAVCGRRGMAATVVFADLDNMKPINDRLGHEEGDRALKDVASRILGSFRVSDVSARVGGDEFCVLLTGEASATFAQALERFRREIDGFNDSAGRPFKLSLSIGCARFDPAAPCELEALMAEADRAMYLEKRSKPGARRD